MSRGKERSIEQPSAVDHTQDDDLGAGYAEDGAIGAVWR